MIRIAICLTVCAWLLGCAPVNTPETTSPFSAIQGQVSSRSADPSYVIAFPADHQVHQDFAVEWWYLTANLRDEVGEEYGLQWTLFRFKSGQNSDWAGEHYFMLHSKLVTPNEHFFNEQFAGENTGNAGVRSSPFRAFLNQNRWESQSEFLMPASLKTTFNNKASGEFVLSPTGLPILHGNKGYSQKHPDIPHASHYYSHKFIDISGTVTLAGKQIALSGQAWFDHEWSDNYLAQGTLGWDWFSLHLQDNQKLMLFTLKTPTNQDAMSKSAIWFGTFVDGDGRAHTLSDQDANATPVRTAVVRGSEYPVDWHIQVPKFGLDITTRAMKDDQVNAGLITYYEGVVFASGTHTGRGFMELTGY